MNESSSLSLSEIPESLYDLAGLSPESEGTEAFATYYWHMVQDLRFAKAYEATLRQSPLLNQVERRRLSPDVREGNLFETLAAEPSFQFLLLRDEISEMLLVRTVSHMMTYLHEILLELAMSGHINVLGEDHVDIAPGAVHPKLTQKIWSILHKQSKRGFESVIQYLHDVGVKVSIDSSKQEELVEIVEDRNLIVHYHGIVHQPYLSRIAGSKRKIGETLDLQFEDVSAKIMQMLEFVGAFDDDIQKQFGLKIRTKDFVAKRFQSRINGMLGPILKLLKSEIYE